MTFLKPSGVVLSSLLLVIPVLAHAEDAREQHSVSVWTQESNSREAPAVAPQKTTTVHTYSTPQDATDEAARLCRENKDQIAMKGLYGNLRLNVDDPKAREKEISALNFADDPSSFRGVLLNRTYFDQYIKCRELKDVHVAYGPTSSIQDSVRDFTDLLMVGTVILAPAVVVDPSNRPARQYVPKLRLESECVARPADEQLRLKRYAGCRKISDQLQELNDDLEKLQSRLSEVEGKSPQNRSIFSASPELLRSKIANTESRITTRKTSMQQYEGGPCTDADIDRHAIAEIPPTKIPSISEVSCRAMQ